MIDLPAQLAARMHQPLPGPAAMRTWSPQLAYGRHFVPPPENARRAAVAVLLYPHEGEWYVPLTLRPAHLSEHAGQVSLPGGSLEAGESPDVGAWRELEEELGVPRVAFAPLGQLTPLYVFISNFHVVPCLAIGHARPEFRPSPAEVAQVIEFPLSALRDPETRGEMWIERRAVRFRAPCWDFGGQRIWGASALILGELAALLAGG